MSRSAEPEGPEAFPYVYARLRTPMLQVALGMTGSRDEAVGALRDACAATWDHYDGVGDPEAELMRRLVAETRGVSWPRGEGGDSLMAALGRVPEQERAAFCLREVAGLDTEGTAVALGVDPARADELALHATERLREAGVDEPGEAVASLLGALVGTPRDLQAELQATRREVYRRRRRRVALVGGGALVALVALAAFLLLRPAGTDVEAGPGSSASTSVASDTTSASTPTSSSTTLATTTAPTTVPSTTAAVQATYAVESGDAWVTIAQKLGVPLELLLEANDATAETVLFPGQVLKVPTISGPSYEVQSGDTWCGIAEKLGVPIDLLLEANGATQSTTLLPDTSIRVPDPASVPADAVPGCPG